MNENFVIQNSTAINNSKNSSPNILHVRSAHQKKINMKDYSNNAETLENNEVYKLTAKFNQLLDLILIEKPNENVNRKRASKLNTIMKFLFPIVISLFIFIYGIILMLN